MEEGILVSALLRRASRDWPLRGGVPMDRGVHRYPHRLPLGRGGDLQIHWLRGTFAIGATRLVGAAPGGDPISVDRAMEIARQAIPAGIVEMAQLPRGPKGTFLFVLRVPEETTGSPHSTVAVDPYGGQVLASPRFPDGFTRVLLDPVQSGDSHGRYLRHNRTRDHVPLQPASGRDGVDRRGDLAEEIRGVARDV